MWLEFRRTVDGISRSGQNSISYYFAFSQRARSEGQCIAYVALVSTPPPTARDRRLRSLVPSFSVMVFGCVLQARVVTKRQANHLDRHRGLPFQILRCREAKRCPIAQRRVVNHLCTMVVPQSLRLE